MAKACLGVNFWITLNEPNVQTSLAYWRGQWPPGKKSLIKYLSANHQLSRAHKAAYLAIKSANSQATVGITNNQVHFTQPAAFLKDYIHNRLFFNSIRNYQDFIGVNYYHSDRSTKETSEFLNWSVDPEGLFFVLINISRYKKPIYILENGIADVRDLRRSEFIKEHLEQTIIAINNGADVRGYFYWSLLDNFEWDKGFWPRFGLAEVDYKTLERKIRPSAWEYAKICREKN